jgi:hypothetical protein
MGRHGLMPPPGLVLGGKVMVRSAMAAPLSAERPVSRNASPPRRVHVNDTSVPGFRRMASWSAAAEPASGAGACTGGAGRSVSVGSARQAARAMRVARPAASTRAARYLWSCPAIDASSNGPDVVCPPIVTRAARTRLGNRTGNPPVPPVRSPRS